jgi:transcriptional regulator with XRE-family HTH domain
MQLVRIDATKIRAFRLARDLGIDDVAHSLRRRGFKTNGATVSKWERGVVTPHANSLPALARTLGVEIDDLYSESDAGDDDEEGDPLSIDSLMRRRARQILREEAAIARERSL